MTKLISMNLGFNELECFNEALHLQIRSETLKRRISEGKNPEKKVVREAMLFKHRDEELTNKEIEKEMREERKKIKTEYGGNSRRTKSILRKLNKVATDLRLETREKYREKIETIKRKHWIDDEEKTSRVPPELTKYGEANIFSKEKFDRIEEPEIVIAKIGDICLSKEENMVLQKHPKFALLENLKIEDLELDFELSFGKYRYQRQKEIREKKEMEKEKKMGSYKDRERDDKTPEERQEEETQEAETRQVYNPMEKTYDARKLKVTDLQINTRACQKVMKPGLKREDQYMKKYATSILEKKDKPNKRRAKGPNKPEEKNQRRQCGSYVHR